MDSLGISSNEHSVYEDFESDIPFVNERYEVKLPFKEKHPFLESNYINSLKRLSNLKKKLDQTPGLLKAYDDAIQQQMKNGVLEKVHSEEKEPILGSVTYLPHRPVFRDDKTTKLRIVYDASAKVNGVSLNDCLYKGPCLTPLIFDALLKFRLHNIAISADIEKAYLQISVFPPHKNFLRFLWFDEINESNPEVMKYRFCRVIFGATCSQYLLNAVLRNHIKQYEETDSEFVDKMDNALYVDDLTSGSRDISEGLEFYQKCKSRFAEGKFNLRKWRTNNIELRKRISHKEGTAENLSGEKVLGITWDENEDFLIISFEDIDETTNNIKITKRIILKVVSSCFEPVGWIQPIIVQLKIIFQESCKLGFDWDDKVSPELAKKWFITIKEIKKLGKIYFPRCYCYNDISNPIVKTELIGFSDASLVAYGCEVKWRYSSFISCI